MEKINQLIHAKWIVTCNAHNQILTDHAIAIKNGKIIAILTSKTAKETYHAESEAHYSSHVVMPGFINSHTHLAMNAFRGLADDLELMDWLNNYIWPAEGKWVSEELVYDMSQLAMAEMIRSGTTCFNDMYFYLDATARAVIDAGMRGTIGMTVIGVPTGYAKTPEEYFEKALAFHADYKNHPLITPTMAPHSTYTVSIEDLAKVKSIADQHDLKINIHLQEAPSEIEHSLKHHKKRPLKRLHEIEMLNERIIAIHMTQIDADEFAFIKEKNVSIVHCPKSNMKLVSGNCPVDQLLKMGVNVALGTDGAASNNDLDMFTEMRFAAYLGKVVANDPKAVPAEAVLRMATINGAKALGMEKVTGSIEVGKSADFIAIDMNEIETQPLYHPISQIVYATPRSQVTDVWVSGKQLLKNRELLTLDEKALIKKAQIWGEKIKSSV